MPNVTIAFDEGVGGWTSEFTFVPDSGQSLNNNFYTFNNGRVWRHNSETADRNTFYGVTGSTIIEFVFNENPTIVKNYKSVNYEGSEGWDTTFATNIENGSIRYAEGTVLSPVQDQWVLKEGERYGWIRGEVNLLNDVDLEAAAVGGIGVISDIVDGTIMFNNPVPGALSVGDIIYRAEVTADTAGPPELVGIVTELGRSSLVVSTTGDERFGPLSPQDFFTPVNGNLLLYVKDTQVEKSGIIGYYNVTTMTNNSPTATELFAVNGTSHISTI